MLSNYQMQQTLRRWNEREGHRNRNLSLISQGRYFDADSPDRVKKFLDRRGFNDAETNEIMRSPKGFPELVESKAVPGELLSLERIIGTNDLVGVAFLENGLNIARTVGRVWIYEDGGRLAGYATGFMISPSLLITNHHVLPDERTAKFSFIEFNYQIGTNGDLLSTEVFRLDPAAFYFTDQTLDYAVVGVSPRSRNNVQLAPYGWNRLLKQEGKTIISQWLNIIQHPGGEPKQVGLRENQLIDVLDNFLHYKTDTAQGASGSPVYNEMWEVVGLHHSGVRATNSAGQPLATDGTVWTPDMGENKIRWAANEGVRVSSILKHLERHDFNPQQKRLYNEIFTTPIPAASKPDRPMENKNVIEQAGNSPLVVSNDGTVTWTIPVSVSVKVGEDLSVPVVPSREVPQNITVTDVNLRKLTSPPESAVLSAAKREFLSRKDVLNVRMGYVFENGWITKKRAVVVTVVQRKSIKELGRESISPLPETFMDFPVEVTGPTFEDLISQHKGVDKLEALISPVAIDVNEIKYFPPEGIKLKQVTDKMHVIAHVSPEEGWKNLAPFLGATKKTLTVAMYDFGAPHIMNAVEEAGSKAGFKNLTMAIQPGQSVGDGTKAHDWEDAAVVDDITEKLGAKKVNVAWVAIGRTNGWVSSSYHIKVAVQDSAAFWLSSGNWQSSNQPDISTLGNLNQPSLLKKYNREWHAIVRHEGLAQTYQKFILHDYENNIDNADEILQLTDGLNFLIPDSILAMAEESAANIRPFKPFEDDRTFTVTPLLTPDNFYDEMLNLVNSAEEELLIQNQTFNAAGDSQIKLQGLLDAVLQKQQSGVRVKIIFRLIVPSVARKNIEALVDMGFDPDSIKIQPNCHTKGVIVDGKRVALGSQNWSNDGVSVNRDASLLFDDAPLAKYFRDIFNHDWRNLARNDIGNESVSLELATTQKSAVPGFKVVGWNDIKEMF